MRTTIEVKNKREGDTIRRALELPDVRVFVILMGELAALPDDRSRIRVLRYVLDKFDDEAKHVSEAH